MECPIRTGAKKDLLLDYCNHTLDAKASAEVEGHLALCPQCKAWTETHSRTWILLDEWEPAPISPDFERRLRERIALEDARTPKWRALWASLLARPLKPALSVVLAGLLLLAGFLFLRPKHVPPPQSNQETMDADHLEKALDDVDMLRQLGVASDTKNSEAM